MNSAEVLIKFKGDTSSADKATSEVSTSLTKLTKAFTLGNIISTGITKGLGILTSNLDGAISRVDTLNNFPKVMSNLGISADDSSEVISDLSEKLQGLPTSIDSAAMAVQRFTSKNGDVKESEKIFLAVNNAILAGGAGADIQASALEQLSQAYAKGKPDMMEWRTLMTAMPAQLKQVATAMGYVDADALGKALREGDASMDDFMNTMMRMNTEGVNGFKSFEDQARNATGGIQTNIKNMKTAFVRGIADIISKIDEALEPVGGLGGVITSMGKIGEKVFKKLGSILSTVIKVFIKLGQWINKNKAWIKPLTVAVATFIATFKTIKKVIAIIKAVKTAIAVLNATMLANPIVLIVAAIAALVAGFIYLWNNCEAFRKFFISLWEAIKNVVMTVVNFIVSFIQGFISTIQAIISPIVEFISVIIDGIKSVIMFMIDFIVNYIKTYIAVIKTVINTAISVFKTVFITIPTWIYNTIIKPVANFFSGLWDGFKNGAKSAWEGIKSIFSTVADFFKNIFSNAWNGVKNIFSTGGKIFMGIVDGIKEAFVKIVNSIIGGINKVVAIPFNGINGVLEKLRNIKIVGKKPFKGLIHTVPVPQIPKLATGTNVVPDDMLAMIHKGEAVVPKKFNPYANMNNSMLGVMKNTRQQQVVNVYASFKQDSLGQTVRNIKTFSGGARNDYNYGVGV